MAKLLLLFIALPAVELALLIEVGARVGTLATLAILFVTGAVGAALVSQQSLRTLRKVQEQLEQGRLPGDALLDGALLLVAGALLITPGIITDTAGLLLLWPVVRRAVKRALARRFERAVAEGRLHVSDGNVGAGWNRGPIYDVTPEPPAEEDPGDPTPPHLH